MDNGNILRLLIQLNLYDEVSELVRLGLTADEVVGDLEIIIDHWLTLRRDYYEQMEQLN